MGLFRRRGIVSGRQRRTIVVHRTGDRPSIRGVLYEELPDGLVLRHAVLLLEPVRRGDPVPDPVALDGDTLLPRESVDFVQDPREAEFAEHRARPRVVPTTVPSAWSVAPDDPRPLRQA